MTKLLRTIRFDESDTRVFAEAAESGEWAVSGAFAFSALKPEEITGKTRQAFANGFLGVASLGRSTFAVVAEADDAAEHEIAYRLALHFVDRYGAPDAEAALPAAREEIAFVADLCREQPINTVFTIRRTFDGDGRIREELRTIRPPTGELPHARIWTVEHDGP